MITLRTSMQMKLTSPGHFLLTWRLRSALQQTPRICSVWKQCISNFKRTFLTTAKNSLYGMAVSAIFVNFVLSVLFLLVALLLCSLLTLCPQLGQIKLARFAIQIRKAQSKSATPPRGRYLSIICSSNSPSHHPKCKSCASLQHRT